MGHETQEIRVERLSQQESSRYSKIHGQRPGTVLDRHRDGRHIALQALDVPLDRAGIWDTQSRKLVWEPKDTVALGWTSGGDQILSVTHRYRGSARHPRQFLTVPDSEVGYELRFASWPGLEPLASCELHLAKGWFDWVGVSPAGNRAAVRWINEEGGGFILVEINRTASKQLDGAEYHTTPNNISVPVFAPDGRNIVLACGRSDWWSTQEQEPLEGATLAVGHIAVYEMDFGPVREEGVRVTIPSGWSPADPGSPEAQLLGDPRFTGPTTFAIGLPNGEERSFDTDALGRL
ncbi:MAG: hypothetical protein M3003_16975 [Candidatus Dormibacteraeota bacterium]|nr:hypothetical protein [Candidatus Dormibacteraeota bacterium]